MEQQIVIPFIVPVYCSIVFAVIIMVFQLLSFKVVITLGFVYRVHRALMIGYQSVNMGVKSLFG